MFLMIFERMSISLRLRGLRTFPLATVELFVQSLWHLNLSSFRFNWKRELGETVTAKIEKKSKVFFIVFAKNVETA